MYNQVDSLFQQGEMQNLSEIFVLLPQTAAAKNITQV